MRLKRADPVAVFPHSGLPIPPLIVRRAIKSSPQSKGFTAPELLNETSRAHSMNDPTFVGWELTRCSMKTGLISRLEKTANSR